MTVRKALAFYLSVVTIAIVGSWIVGYFGAWWVGMALLTLLVLEHVWRYVKIIVKNKP